MVWVFLVGMGFFGTIMFSAVVAFYFYPDNTPEHIRKAHRAKRTAQLAGFIAIIFTGLLFYEMGFR